MRPRELLNRIRDRLARDRLGRELEEELRFHRAMIERDARAAGTAERELPSAIAAQMGNTTYYREEARDMWSLGSLDELLQELRYGARAVRATPAFSLVVTLTLALGIGATTAIFTVVDSVLLRPLPYANPSSLVALIDVEDDDRRAPASYREYMDWRTRASDVFSDVAADFGTGAVLQTADGAEQLLGSRVSANLPRLLGIHPILGRVFRADEDRAGAPQVVMLSERVWRDQFAADPSIVGRTITLTGSPWTVVGVFAGASNTLIPSPFAWSHHRLPDFWLPLSLDDKTSPPGLHWLDVVGRLRPGVDVARARTRLDAISAAIKHDRATTHSLAIAPLAEHLVGSFRAPLRLLLGAVLVLLLIACVNTANLLLARTATRRREFAVRSALGAGRARLLRLVLVESVVRAAAGGVIGVALAYALVRGMRVWLVGTVARIADASIDGRVLAAAVVVTLACGIAFGLLPARRAGSGDSADDLRDGARGSSGVARDRARRGLMVAEVALSFMLLATAGLLTRSVINLLHVPEGFDTHDLVAGFTWLPSNRYPDSLAQKRFYDRLIVELGNAYGPQHVALASELPVSGGTNGGVDVQGRKFPNGVLPNAEKRIVSPNYLTMLGAHLVAGRWFTSSDDIASPGVVVINETLARTLFPNENPLGKRVGFNWGIEGFQTVVGVVTDLREGTPDQPSRPAIYISTEQRPDYEMRFLVRTNAPPPVVAFSFRAILRKLDPTIPLVETSTIDGVVREGTQQQRLTTIMVGSFAAVALALAAIGMFGVISYSVTQRTQELGLRAALGALPGDLMRLVLGQAAGYTMGGITIGAVGAFATRRLVATQLFGVGPSDATTLCAAAFVLACVAVAGAFIPMRRAASADPMDALRAQ